MIRNSTARANLDSREIGSNARNKSLTAQFADLIAAMSATMDGAIRYPR
jgi:hypothetical protein